MDSKTVKLNFLTLGDLENEPISKKVECSFKELFLISLICMYLFIVNYTGFWSPCIFFKVSELCIFKYPWVR